MRKGIVSKEQDQTDLWKEIKVIKNDSVEAQNVLRTTHTEITTGTQKENPREVR